MAASESVSQPMKLYRGGVFTPTGNPFRDPGAWRFIEDGFVAVDGGVIAAVGEWSARPADVPAVDIGEKRLIVPGFVDLHLHGPQLEMIGSYGGHLLEWLNRYTFPNEAKFADEPHARAVARAFFSELIRHGTLTALVFSSTHTVATRCFFEEAGHRRFRAILGKTLMDRNAPGELLEAPQKALDESRLLIREWHGRGKLGYAITPRFAPTSTPELLEVAGTLLREFPDAWVHSHVSENVAEVNWVRQLFPEAGSYAGVYDRYGLLGRKTILAHGVHLSDGEMDLLSARGARIAHCPNSNLFLGSGLFPLQRVMDRNVCVGLGTDIGAGTTLSMFNVMADAYKVQQVRGMALNPFQLWYLATLAGAEALGLQGVTGSLEPGKAADFLVLDGRATPLLATRTSHAGSPEEMLAAFIFLADDRAIVSRWIDGEEATAGEPGMGPGPGFSG